MSQITSTRTIDAPADLVFRTVSDIRNFAEAVPDIVDVEMLSDVTEDVGTRFRETRVMRGREATTELEVTEYVENDRVRLVADSHGTVWDSVFTVTEVDEHTELKLVMDSRPYELLAKLLDPLMKMFVRRGLEKDMDAVKTYCERK